MRSEEKGYERGLRDGQSVPPRLQNKRNRKLLVMKKRIQKILCWFGFHKWHSDCANFDCTASGDTVAVIWWECPECGANKLKFIGK
jgi:hypothetical protein